MQLTFEKDRAAAPRVAHRVVEEVVQHAPEVGGGHEHDRQLVEQVDDADAIRVGGWLRGHDHVGDEFPEWNERLIGVERAGGDA